MESTSSAKAPLGAHAKAFSGLPSVLSLSLSLSALSPMAHGYYAKAIWFTIHLSVLSLSLCLSVSVSLSLSISVLDNELMESPPSSSAIHTYLSALSLPSWAVSQVLTFFLLLLPLLQSWQCLCHLVLVLVLPAHTQQQQRHITTHYQMITRHCTHKRRCIIVIITSEM